MWMRVMAMGVLCGIAVLVLVAVDKEHGQSETVLHVPKSWEQPEYWEQKLAIFPTVFWEPADTIRFRRWMRSGQALRGKVILEIGTGSGLLALDLLKLGAERVIATDLNSNAVANARFNARVLGLEDRLEVRQVSPERSDAYSTLGAQDTFDLIVSNPPWEDNRPGALDELAWYDPGFVLLDSLLSDLPARLKPGGRAYLIYGAKAAIHRILQQAPQYGLKVRILEDDRNLDELGEVFLPGMVLELEPSKDSPDH